MTPLTNSAKKIDQVDSKIMDMGKFYIIKEKVINKPKLLEVGVAN